MAKTAIGGVGTNQYQIRGRPKDPVDVPLVAVVPKRLRCGVVWGTGCHVWVTPPDCKHDRHPHPESVRLQADNPHARPEALAYIVRVGSPHSRKRVGANPATTPEILVELANIKETPGYVRPSVAGNPNTPIGVLVDMLNDHDLQVRVAAAGNPSTPAEGLHRVFSDTLPVQTAAMGNRNMPPEVLERWSNCNDPAIRAKIAGNPSTPATVLAALIADPEDVVSLAARTNPALPDYVRSILVLGQ